MSALLDDLRARGLVHDSTDADALTAHLDAGAMTLYYGCDPTADSLHGGNLIGLLILRRFAEAGHRPLALVGGSTGMIGDPSGRSEERNMLDEATLATNVARIGDQVARLTGAELVNNADWTLDVTLVEFLRDVGKHVTVNQMVAKESVKARLASEQGISFTEFSYMLLQAFDFWWLHERQGCTMQIGGSDQWGNITAGIDLIRRRTGAHAHGLTWPLITRADGTKFGKSMGENIWLAADRTSPYRLFQYFMNADDRDVERFLLQLTMLDVDEVEAIVTAHTEAPHQRRAQRRLAEEVTALVHGEDAAHAAAEASTILFGGDPTTASTAAFAVVAGELTVVPPPPHTAVGDDIDPVAVLVSSGLAKSNSDARRSIRDGAVRASGRKLGEDDPIVPGDALHGRYILLARGKKYFALVDLEKTSS